VPPGTLVDGGLTAPGAFEFLLCSHAGGAAGQTRPALYRVAVDESGFAADGLVVLTYWLTYLFARCTK
jgi:eukaryotic translation initiation factor 2C